jgi:hypothetical protein
VKGGEAYNGGTVGTTNHVLIAHNQLEKINVSGTAYTGTGRPFQLSGVNDFVVDHNTVNNPATSLLVIFPAAMGQRFQFSNNVGYKGTYGLHGLDTYAANAVVTGNAIVLQSTSTTTLTAASTTTLYSAYGTGNVGVSSWSAAVSKTGTDGYLVGADATTVSKNTSAVAP